jgi:pSer/pThr/pTyr-binding forkhead associated (FHA) protein
MAARIIVVTGPDRGQSFQLLAGSTLQVGRAQTTGTKLSDPSVSRTHCEIHYDGTRAEVVNLSDKGTAVNGKTVPQQELRHGDVIRIGATELRVQIAAVEEAETVLQPAPTT